MLDGKREEQDNCTFHGAVVLLSGIIYPGEDGIAMSTPIVHRDRQKGNNHETQTVYFGRIPDARGQIIHKGSDTERSKIKR